MLDNICQQPISRPGEINLVGSFAEQLKSKCAYSHAVMN